MSSTAQGYNSYYKYLALSPELGIFRRFGSFWAKKLHDETSEVLACLAALEDEFEKWPDLSGMTVLDCPRRRVKQLCSGDKKKYKLLKKAWFEYDRALVRYGMFDSGWTGDGH
jgi:hypothetical protein